jgi:adenylate cyclase
VLLEGVTLPGSDEAIDIEILLAEDGRMLLNWPRTNFIDSFRHITFYRLVDHWEKEGALLSLVRDMDQARYFDYIEGADQLIPLYDYADQLKDDVVTYGDHSVLAEWREYRQIFFGQLGQVLNSDAEAYLLEDYQYAIDSGQLSDAQVEEYQAVMEEVSYNYGLARHYYDQLAANRAVLAEEIPGSFIIIGWTGTGTSDIGVNPFFERYVNVGTHGAVVNTIMQGEFLDDMPWWIPFVIAAGLALLVTFVSYGLNPVVQLIIGFGAVVILAAAGVTVFLVTGVYPNMVTPIAVVFISFVTLTARNFLVTARDRARIRSTFGKYISKGVVDAVLEDPEAQSMGGRNKELTAIFTDVQGFSTISEKLGEMHGENGAQMLGLLLNRYLTEMSNVVLEEDGTIDKYEGDAIIAFFGAPVDLPDAPVRACRSAIRMKKLERHLNEVLLEEKLAPNPLLTRIGINTGIMSVGNFGTEERRDFTIMGHHVNLAARLEGVNKQYGTWILVSQNTYDKTCQGENRIFSARRLDRVRVVGVKEPLRLYELIDLREEVDKDHQLIEMLRAFNKALDLFEVKEWNDAAALFKRCLDAYPEDGPSQTYYKRCTSKKFIEEANKPSFDGIFNLTQK